MYVGIIPLVPQHTHICRTSPFEDIPLIIINTMNNNAKSAPYIDPSN